MLPAPPWPGAPAPVALPDQSEERRSAPEWLQVILATDLRASLRVDQKSIKASDLYGLPIRSLSDFLDELHRCEWPKTWVRDLYDERYGDWLAEREGGTTDELNLFGSSRREGHRRREVHRSATTLSPLTTLIPPAELSDPAQARLATMSRPAAGGGTRGTPR